MAIDEKTVKIGSVKRFGTRYGRTTKERYGTLEALQKTKYMCPNCHYENIRRVSSGIWECTKCSKKFAGRAYTLGSKTIKMGESVKGDGIIEASPEETVQKEEPVEQEE